MTTKEGKDTAYFQERRQQAAKEVKIQFIDGTFTSFNVLDEDGKTKYQGKIDIEKNLEDECSCDSWWYGMKFDPLNAATPDALKLFNKEKPGAGKRGESRYIAENGIAFQCKHIMAAKYARTSGEHLQKILREAIAESQELS